MIAIVLWLASWKLSECFLRKILKFLVFPYYQFSFSPVSVLCLLTVLVGFCLLVSTVFEILVLNGTS